MDDQVRVMAYDAEWPSRFGELKSRIWPWVADHALGLEHVGSTSVPGLAAKDIIDVDVIIAGSDKLNACIGAICANGYEHVGERGITGRHAFEGGDEPRHNLYVCLDGSLGLHNHLVIRDFLRANPERAAAYGQLKLRLAKKHANDIASYTTRKTDFLVGLLREIGLSEADLAEVDASNQK